MSSYSDFLSLRSNELIDFYKQFFREEEAYDDYNVYVKAFKHELEFLRSDWNSIDSLDFVNTKSLEREFVTLNRQLNEIDVLSDYIYQEDLSRNSLLATYINSHELMHQEIVNVLRRIRQKLNLLNSSEQSYSTVLLENFSNLDYIFNNSNTESLLIDTYAKVATLNLDGAPQIINISNIKLGATSNGLSGDYDIVANSDLNSLIDGDPSTYFSYHKINNGPLKLSLVFEFSSETIINEISILPQSKFRMFDYEIEDAIYTNNSLDKYSIKDLVDKNEQTFKVRIVEKESLNVFKHLPVVANKCTLNLIQKSPYVSYEDNVETHVFNISIKDISFKKNKYLSEGVLSSTQFELDPNLKSLTAEIVSYPKNFNLYNLDLSYSLGNDEYNKIVLNNNFKTDTVYFDNNRVSLSYSLLCKRNALEFKNFSFYNVNNSSYKIKKQVSRVNPNVSPNYINFDNLFVNDSITLLKPKIAVISNDIDKSVKLGRVVSGPTNQSIALPFNLYDYGFKNTDLLIYGNRILWIEVDSEEELSFGKYLLGSNGREIIISYSDSNYVQFSFLIKENYAPMEDIGDKLIVYPNLNFDFDPDNIVIKNVIPGVSIEEAFPASSNGRLNLNSRASQIDNARNLITNEELDLNNFTLLSDNVTKITDPAYNNLAIAITYQSVEINTLNTKSIYFKDKVATGILINKEDVQLKTLVNPSTFIISDNDEFTSFKINAQNIVMKSLVIKDLFYDYYLSAQDGYNTENSSEMDYEAKNFSEVTFIDGIREFFKIDEIVDSIPSEELGNDNLLGGSEYFIIARIKKTPFENLNYRFNVKLYNQNNDRQYKLTKNTSLTLDYITQQTPQVLLSQYDGLYNPENGLCLLKFDVTQTGYNIENYYLKYFTQNPSSVLFANKFLFSVDYKNSIVYLNKKIKRSTFLTRDKRYSLSNIILNYDLVKKYYKWEYDKTYKTISLDNLELDEDSLNVKILYFQPENTKTLEDIESYFSPIFYSVKLGLN